MENLKGLNWQQVLFQYGEPYRSSYVCYLREMYLKDNIYEKMHVQTVSTSSFGSVHCQACVIIHTLKITMRSKLFCLEKRKHSETRCVGYQMGLK